MIFLQFENKNQLDLGTILQFIGLICIATIQKNNVFLANIILQFISVLAKFFLYTLTNIANYVSSLLLNKIRFSFISHMFLSKINYILSIN